ncbi:unnamed protein product [Tilletia controversa]|nr:unnamed protein product [Tilletia controversa]
MTRHSCRPVRKLRRYSKAVLNQQLFEIWVEPPLKDRPQKLTLPKFKSIFKELLKHYGCYEKAEAHKIMKAFARSHYYRNTEPADSPFHTLEQRYIMLLLVHKSLTGACTTDEELSAAAAKTGLFNVQVRNYIAAAKKYDVQLFVR